MKKFETKNANNEKEKFLAIVVDPSYDNRNGLMDAKQHAIVQVCGLMEEKHDSLRAVIGMCQEHADYRKRALFLRMRRKYIRMTFCPTERSIYTLANTPSGLMCSLSCKKNSSFYCGTSFLEAEIPEGVSRWTVQINFPKHSMPSMFIGIGVIPREDQINRPERRLDYSGGCSLRIYLDQVCLINTVYLDGPLTVDEVKGIHPKGCLKLAVHDGSTVAAELHVRGSYTELYFFLGGQVSPWYVILPYLFKPQLGIEGSDSVSFITRSFIRLSESTTSYPCPRGVKQRFRLAEYKDSAMYGNMVEWDRRR